MMVAGEASFSEIAFVGNPGSKGNKFFVRTGLINDKNLIQWLGEEQYKEFEAWFTVDF